MSAFENTYFQISIGIIFKYTCVCSYIVFSFYFVKLSRSLPHTVFSLLYAYAYYFFLIFVNQIQDTS